MSAADFHTFEDLPGTSEPAVAAEARGRIMARHLLATLRAANGKTLNELAQVRDVSKAAIHQLENRPLAKMSIGSLLGYLQALGYAVDEEWVAQSLVDALPAPAGSQSGPAIDSRQQAQL